MLLFLKKTSFFRAGLGSQENGEEGAEPPAPVCTPLHELSAPHCEHRPLPARAAGSAHPDECTCARSGPATPRVHGRVAVAAAQWTAVPGHAPAASAHPAECVHGPTRPALRPPVLPRSRPEPPIWPLFPWTRLFQDVTQARRTPAGRRSAPSPGTCTPRSSVRARGSVAHFLLVLNNIPSSGRTTVGLFPF